jgi:FkbM family methyltransferase
MLAGGPADIQTDGITFRVPSTREPVAMHLIADGGYEPDLCAVLASRLNPSSVFFDVGSNVGVMSLSAAHRWCPQGRVVGFEASPKIFECLDHNARTNPHPSLSVLNRAVTGQSGQHLTFYDAPDEKFGMGSLTNRFGSSGVQVSTITLDDAASELGIERVDVIKVDVEGFELGVFQGAQRLLQQNPAPFIVFEFNDWAEDNGTTKPGDAQRFLRDLGYTTLPLDRWQRGDLKLEPVIVSGGENIVAFKPSIQ